MTYFQLSVEDIIRRLRRVMLLVMVVDIVCTIAGQPSGYWQDYSKVNEIEPITRFFLIRGVLPYSIGALGYVMATWCLVSFTPKRIALTLLFALLLAHFWGATSWLLYHFRYGVRSQNFLEIAIAALIALALGTWKTSAPKS